jgi:hypothetical protein
VSDIKNFISYFSLACLLASCMQAEYPPATAVPRQAAPMSERFIIKFRDAKSDPARVEFMRGLSRDAGATLVYVRPLSGDAHVMRVERLLNAPDVAAVIERLSKRPDVEYAEPDVKLRHQ